MATCRTCKYCVRKPFAKLTIFDLDKERMPYICEVFMRGETPEMTLDDEHDCIDFEARPPPLLDVLADELCKALEVIEVHAPNHPVRDSGDQVLERYLRDPDRAEAFRARALAHQEEVGDDPH